MSVKVSVTGPDLAVLAEQTAQRATEIVLGELSAAFDQSFTAEAWRWPRETKRSDGSTVRSPRNLIDIGNLRGTASWEMNGPYSAIFKWSADYATAVHEGYVTKLRGGRQGPGQLVPARPWTRAVLGQENVSGIQVYNLGERLQNVWLATLRSRGR